MVSTNCVTTDAYEPNEIVLSFELEPPKPKALRVLAGGCRACGVLGLMIMKHRVYLFGAMKMSGLFEPGSYKLARSGSARVHDLIKCFSSKNCGPTKTYKDLLAVGQQVKGRKCSLGGEMLAKPMV